MSKLYVPKDIQFKELTPTQLRKECDSLLRLKDDSKTESEAAWYQELLDGLCETATRKRVRL